MLRAPTFGILRATYRNLPNPPIFREGDVGGSDLKLADVPLHVSSSLLAEAGQPDVADLVVVMHEGCRVDGAQLQPLALQVDLRDSTHGRLQTCRCQCQLKSTST